jgi:hypothetical protein
MWLLKKKCKHDWYYLKEHGISYLQLRSAIEKEPNFYRDDDSLRYHHKICLKCKKYVDEVSKARIDIQKELLQEQFRAHKAIIILQQLGLEKEHK